jgi:hypothetical protein
MGQLALLAASGLAAFGPRLAGSAMRLFGRSPMRAAALGGAVGLGGAHAVSSLGGGGGLFGGDDDKRRRRRKKALSESDIRQALTIASAISKKAAENFVLMRVRRG